MALMTRAEVKQYLKVTSTADDQLIDAYIPVIEEDLCEYCNNYFQDRFVYRSAVGGIAFVRGNTATATTTADTITDDDKELSTNSGAGFRAGMDIVVEGTWANDGIHTIKSLTSATLTLESTGELIGQDQDSYYTGSGQKIGAILISRVNWPKAIKPIAAKMIWTQVSDAKPGNVQNESIDDYSVTFVNGSAYPSRVMKGLDKWRNAVLV